MPGGAVLKQRIPLRFPGSGPKYQQGDPEMPDASVEEILHTIKTIVSVQVTFFA